MTKRIMINFLFIALCLIAGLGEGRTLLAQEQSAAEESKTVEPAGAKVDKALLKRWKNLSPEEKEKLKKRYELLKDMPAQERQALKENLKRFKNLPPERQEGLRKNWEKFNNLSPQERQAFQNNHKRWQGLAPDKKDILRRRHKKLSEMNPQERQDFSRKQKRWQGMAPAEKERIRRRNLKDSGIQKRHPGTGGLGRGGREKRK